jgi:phosphatidylglycerophosphate synthase
MLANWITLSRLPLLGLVIGLLYLGSPPVRLVAVGVLFIGLMLDTVDGLVARRRGESSLIGSVLDIAADRMYELVLWIWFAGLGMISPAIPIIVAARTALTDALRGIGVAQGNAPFLQHRTPLGRFLVGSTWMRTGYAVTKVLTFCGLALAIALSGGPRSAAAAGGVLLRPLSLLAWAAAAFCVLRGLPVIFHAARYYWRATGGAGTGPAPASGPAPRPGPPATP